MTITSHDLVRDPSKVNRLGLNRPHRCSCGRPTWDEMCRKCARAYRRQFGKQQDKYYREEYGLGGPEAQRGRGK